MFNINNKTAKSLVLAALLVLSVFGAGIVAGAAPTAGDTSGDTSADITDGGTQTHNDTTTSDLPWSADSPNASIEIAQDGETIYEASPEHYDSNDSDDDGTTDTWYYNVSLADDGSDYEGFEVGAGENTTFNVTFVNDTEADDPDETNISYTFENSEENAFIASEDPESEEQEDGGFFSSLNVFSSDDEEEVGTVLSEDETTVTNNTSQVQLDTLDSNLTDAYAASTEDAESGDILWNSYTHVDVEDGDDQFVAVFYEEAGDKDWLDEDEDAYATISEDGDTMTIHNANALLGDDQESATMDVTTVGDEMLGQNNALSMMTDDYGASTWDVWGASYSALDTDGNPEIVNDALEA